MREVDESRQRYEEYRSCGEDAASSGVRQRPHEVRHGSRIKDMEAAAVPADLVHDRGEILRAVVIDASHLVRTLASENLHRLADHGVLKVRRRCQLDLLGFTG